MRRPVADGWRKIMTELRDRNLLIRFPVRGDETGLVAFYERNRDHLLPSGSIILPGDLTLERWGAFITDAEQERVKPTAIRFLIFHDDLPGSPIGKINYTQIFRGPLQACYLGYGLDGLFCRRGIMARALTLTNRVMFEQHNLHRIMANYLPENVASGRVLEKLGFVREGIAKDYLRINGVWRDHVLTSLTNERWQAR